MGTITVSVDDDVEERFRKRVREKYGQKKGVLGKAFTEAMETWAKDEDMQTFERLLEEGIDFEDWQYEDRSELHDRV